VIHTNKKHPFFTEEQGFVPVGQLKLGMHVLRADGYYGVITGYRLVPGAKVMYNLEVAQDHTFTVGVGQWVVHNFCPINKATKAMQRDVQPTIDRIKAGISDPHYHDGDVFQNRDGDLPLQPDGYYHEYVIRTPGVPGPGLQRLIVGGNFDVMYYSPFHYRLVFYEL
jgi:guanyl-specific ribonuclease Sa